MAGVFIPVRPDAPSFVVRVTTAPQVFPLASSERQWDTLDGLAVRLASMGAEDFYVAFGGPWTTVTVGGGVLILGGTVEAFGIGKANITHMAIIATSPTLVNVTPGFGA
jgi:hypothetical protein